MICATDVRKIEKVAEHKHFCHVYSIPDIFSEVCQCYFSMRCIDSNILHDSTLNRAHHGGFKRQLLFLIALRVMKAFLEGTQYITLLLPIREIQTTTVFLIGRLRYIIRN